MGPATGVDPAAVVVAATACAALAALGPAVLARVPDPPSYDDEDADVPAEVAADHVAYPTFAELAARPGLGLWLALAAGLLGAGAGAWAGWSWQLSWLVVLVPLGVLLGYVDWRTYLLPTRLIYPGYAVVAVLMVVAALVDDAGDDLRRAAIVAVVALVLYWLPWRINASWMGFGDVRLSGLLGGVLGWAGWAETALGLYLPFLLGGVVAGGLVLLRLLPRGAHPLGPFMFLGTYLGLLLGPVVLPGLA